LIRNRLLESHADIVCLQETSAETFEDDFRFLLDANYDVCLHKKFRFRCATFFDQGKLELDQEAHKDRTLVTALKFKTQEPPPQEDRLLIIINCHLSGGAAPDRRLRQVHEGLDQIRKWQDKALRDLEKQEHANRPNVHAIEKARAAYDLYQSAGIMVCGDFNSDGNTAVRRLLVTGQVEPEWREPQYPNLVLTSKARSHSLPTFLDAAELAYGANVCDGDYGQEHCIYHDDSSGCRPATYIVPNLASLLLLPPEEGSSSLQKTEFGFQVAQGIARSLGMKQYSEAEMEQAFDAIDLDGNGVIDHDEVQQLLESVYQDLTTRSKGQQQPEDSKLEQDRQKFFGGFYDMASSTTNNSDDNNSVVGLSREQFKERLVALQQQLHGGHEGVELVEIQTDLDVQRMVERFTPVLLESLDFVFDKFASSSNGEEAVLSQVDVDKFLIRTNGEVGRGGMWRHTQAVFEEKEKAGEALALNRQNWYELFARELGEGKWWQVVYDLEVCGANLRASTSKATTAKKMDNAPHYQGWLDYMYFDSQRLKCQGVQEALTNSELARVYQDGDALPNAWHPSDHLPVAAVFSYRSPEGRREKS